MTADNWITLVSILATLSVSLGTILIGRRREKLQQQRDDQLRKAQQAREDSIRDEQRTREEEERTRVAHGEYSVECKFFGPERDSYLVEVLLFVRNTSRLRQEFNGIQLRMRGIQGNVPLTFWKGREPRLYFPEKLIDDVSVIPTGWDFLFVEPGDQTMITFVTRIPASIKYVLAYVTFTFDSGGSHDIERVFPVRAG